MRDTTSKCGHCGFMVNARLYSIAQCNQLIAEAEAAPRGGGTVARLGTDGKLHHVSWGYCGGGQYNADCLCGWASDAQPTDDDAALAASMHLAEVEILAEAMV